MITRLFLTTLLATSMSGGTLPGQHSDILYIDSVLHKTPPIHQTAIIEEKPITPEETTSEVIIEESEEPEAQPVVTDVVEENPTVNFETDSTEEYILKTAEATSFAETPAVDEEPTYDFSNQRDVGTVTDVVPPEVSDTWYVEETAQLGLETILTTYALTDYDSFIITTPSNYVYQYDFYVESPAGGYTNLLGTYQYDATGQRTFYLNPITGVWE